MPDSLERSVGQLPPGWDGHYYAEVTSTQDVARAALAAGAPSKSVFVGDYQSAGRGRQGRSWQAQPTQALMLSILLRQAGEPRPWRSTALVSVALVDALEGLLPEMQGVAIKWPNDVLIGGRKVAGVLAESTSDGAQTSVIVGLGVNVTATDEDLAEIAAPTTSLLIASGQSVDRGLLLLRLIDRLDDWLVRQEPELHDRWQSRLWGRGQRVRLIDLDITEDVVVLGAGFDGALRVRLPDGRELSTTTAELIL